MDSQLDFAEFENETITDNREIVVNPEAEIDVIDDYVSRIDNSEENNVNPESQV